MRLALESGEIDLAYKTLNPSDIKDLSTNDKFITNKLQGPYIRYICYETSESVFKDKLLRQAMSALVDRQGLYRQSLSGTECSSVFHDSHGHDLPYR